MQEVTFESHDSFASASSSATATERGPSKLTADAAEAQSPTSGMCEVLCKLVYFNVKSGQS